MSMALTMPQYVRRDSDATDEHSLSTRYSGGTCSGECGAAYAVSVVDMMYVCTNMMLRTHR